MIGLDPLGQCQAELAEPSPICRHIGQQAGELILCQSCPGRVRLKTFTCVKFGECTPYKPIPGVQCCKDCPAYSQKGY